MTAAQSQAQTATIAETMAGLMDQQRFLLEGGESQRAHAAKLLEVKQAEMVAGQRRKAAKGVPVATQLRLHSLSW